MKHEKPIVIKKGEGRKYRMGPIQATFLADQEETNEKYSVSKWQL
tara:strand:+ start:7656 stop:7790 length:135 start_codon:yes stop_codon:yes gene_type:complete